MTSAAELGTNNQRAHLGLAYRPGSTVILLTVFFTSSLKLVEFFVRGKMSGNVLANIALAAAIGAIVILLLPKIIALTMGFFARLWHVMHYVILAEGLVLVFSIIWFRGDGPEIFAFWTNGWNNGLWYLHAWMCFHVLKHMRYLLSGRVPSAGSYDDDSSSTYTENEDYGVNPSTGLPMIGGAIDAGGYMLGEQPSTFDSSSSSSSLFDVSSTCGSPLGDSGSCVSPFDREIGSSFNSSSSGSMFDD
jgi:hypothetical protein